MAAALLFLVVAGGPFAASAQPDDAEKRSAEGRLAYDAGDYGKALSLFKQAFALNARASYLFNSAKTCLRLEDSEGAVYFYRRYLEASPLAADRQAVEDDLARLTKLLVERGLVEVQLRTEPPGAAVSVSPSHATEVAMTPGSLFLPAGSHTVRFVLEGYQPADVQVSVVAGTSAPQVAKAVLKQNLASGWNVVIVEPPLPVEEGFPWRTVSLVAAGTGGAAALTGGLLYWVGWNGMNDANDNYETTSKDYNEDYRSGADKAELGSWLLVGGLGVAAGATVAWFLQPDHQPSVPVSVTPVPGGVVGIVDLGGL